MLGKAGTRVVVVGAGLAGLAAADELRHGGADVIVVEARDRVGGRVFSKRLCNGALIEMGAEFILPGSTLTRELATRFGLGLWDKAMRYGEREPRGGIGIDEKALAAAVAEVDRALARAGPGELRLPARKFLGRVQLDAGAREAILARAEVSSASSAAELPAVDLAHIAHIGPDPAPSVAGGNQRLALALAAGLGDSLMLKTPVRRIAWRVGGVRVELYRLPDPKVVELEADACLVAVPASAIGGIRFDPPLPPRRANALKSVRYGQAAKLFVPLREPSPPSAVLSVPERYWTWTATGDGDRPQPVVSAFAGSAPALERLGVSEGPSTWLDSLARLRPDLAMDPDGAVLSTWSDDPWARAAYAVSPGPELTEALQAPLGPLAFAGEHTGGEFAGLMEGALRSGQRAARQLLERSA
jgi:monoamine oxidase